LCYVLQPLPQYVIGHRRLHIDPLCDVAGTTSNSASPLRDIWKRKFLGHIIQILFFPHMHFDHYWIQAWSYGTCKGAAFSFLLLSKSNSSSDIFKSSDTSPSNRISNSAYQYILLRFHLKAIKTYTCTQFAINTFK
jgi:hypothetical protein